MKQANGNRLLLMALAGGLGGLLAFILINPSALQSEEMRASIRQGADFAEEYREALFFGLVIGMSIGGALVALDELLLGVGSRLFRRVFLGLAIGAAAGAVGGIVAQYFFNLLLSPVANSRMGMEALPLLILARALVWAMLGAMAGICPGVVAASPRRLLYGVLGGSIGGGIGGFIFDMISMPVSNGGASRFLGLTIMGAAIGMAISVVETMSRRFWLTGVNGPKEGRTFLLDRPTTVLGRDERADIPLFGDPAVQKQHALINVARTDAQITAVQGQTVTVNSQPFSFSPLNDGDFIGVGRHLFRFHARQTAGNPVRQATPVDHYPPFQQSPPALPGYPSQYPSSPSVAAAPTQVFTQPPQTPMQSEPAFSVPTCLRVVGGPYTGGAFPLDSGGAIIGREPSCAICLANDIRVSRQHARVTWDGAAWVIEDMESTNGLYVNGVRTQQRPLQPGDILQAGDTMMRAE